MFKKYYFFNFTRWNGSVEVGEGFRVFWCNFWVNPSVPLMEIVTDIEKSENVNVIINIFNRL